MNPSRFVRFVVALWMAAGAVQAQTTAAPQPSAVAPVSDMALGSPKAKVTVVEYASVGCPHCAVWARTVFPQFKKAQIDTGRVRFVFREMLTGDSALAAAGFLTARCAGPKKYFQVVDAVFAQQEQIEHGGAAVLAVIAKDAGLNDKQLEACLADEAALKALTERTTKDAKDHGVTGTPTFLVQGRKLEGDQSLAQLQAAIAAVPR